MPARPSASSGLVRPSGAGGSRWAEAGSPRPARQGRGLHGPYGPGRRYLGPLGSAVTATGFFDARERRQRGFGPAERQAWWRRMPTCGRTDSSDNGSYPALAYWGAGLRRAGSVFWKLCFEFNSEMCGVHRLLNRKVPRLRAGLQSLALAVINTEQRM